MKVVLEYGGEDEFKWTKKKFQIIYIYIYIKYNNIII